MERLRRMLVMTHLWGGSPSGTRSVLCVSYSVQDRPVFINKFVASEAQLRVILSKQAGGVGWHSRAEHNARWNGARAR